MPKRALKRDVRRPLFEALERRILLSADLAPVLPESLLQEADQANEPAAHVELYQEDGAITQSLSSVRRELVVVDTGTPGYEQLVEDLRASSSATRLLDVVLLDAGEDGVSQITDALNRYDGLDAVHIVSHGTQGGVQLGSTWLSNENLDVYRTAVASWGDALSEDADLLFYGCDLASGEAGSAFVDSLAGLTGADVAASIDLTGSALLGGDWELEYAAGTIETGVAFSSELRSNWAGVLVSTSFQEGIGGYASTQDTELDAAAPDADNSNVARIDVDSSPSKQALIRFEDIFGGGPGQIPLGSTISSASLTVDVTLRSRGREGSCRVAAGAGLAPLAPPTWQGGTNWPPQQPSRRSTRTLEA